ncbi:cytochrome oxidase assembly protein ShyY1 [Kineococcus xinjiangensis]|uniref:SURF1-like protein n=1 Tax=Kineococcus xinjiangensis TaxID=512762 RepID=A0A2S6IPI9_9ACTN|nr:SURF1 family protein [Kineococcus xinjiangensis]PPK96172.1 cytochrome oxidase assembly protein ShyY1 [Kineococcus xinjiangensis]
MPTSVLGLLRERRWVAGLAVACAVAVVCVVLGQWQWQRRADRQARTAPLVANYDAPVRDLDAVLPADSTLQPGEVWTPVRVRGRYDPEHTLLARNRPLEKSYGYAVLVPLLLPDGSALLVDRGWIPAGQDGSAPDAVPAPPPGEVDVTVRLRRWEADRDNPAPQGQVQSIAAQDVAAEVPRPLREAYGVLAAEEPRPARAPVLLPRPPVDQGPHLAYTVQWYAFALTSLVVWVVAGRRELQARAAAGAGGDRVAAPPARRRRDQLSDEEAEDAEVERSTRP